MGLEDTILIELQQPEKAVFSTTAGCSIVFLFLFISYTRSIRESTTAHSELTYAHSLPVLLLIASLASALHPWRSKRKWLFMLYQVIMAPLYPVCFRDGYIGDLLTSLVRVAVPLVSGLIYALMAILAWLSNNFEMLGSSATVPWWEKTYFFRHILVPFLTLYPLWIRLLQCLRRSAESGQNWPHHGNALKYTSAISVISFGSFQPKIRASSFWIGGLVFATLFQLAWDVTMDWGLLAYTKPTGYKSSKLSWRTMLGGIHLRSSRLLGPRWVYFAILVFNIIFRFAWTLTVWPYSLSSGDDSSDPLFLQMLFRHTGPFLASAEVVRRMVWGFLRVEWEHVEVLGRTVALTSNNNTDSYHHDGSELVAVSQPSDKLINEYEVAMVDLSTNNDNNKKNKKEEPSSGHTTAATANVTNEMSMVASKSSKAALMEAADRDLGSFEQVTITCRSLSFIFTLIQTLSYYYHYHRIFNFSHP